jgi:RNA-binding protein
MLLYLIICEVIVVERLKGFQKKYLKGLAHGLKPVVFIGQKGFSGSVEKAIDDALDKHELIKVKFIDFKEKSRKKEILNIIQKNAVCEEVGMVGHVATIFRRHKETEKRKIILPKKDR